MRINTNVKIENYCNTDIKYCCFSDEIMKDFGFRWVKSCNHWVKFYGFDYDIFMQITVDKNNNGKIEIIDSDVGQNYDFQSMIINGNSPKVALEIQKNVYEIMEQLLAMGVISNWKIGDFI